MIDYLRRYPFSMLQVAAGTVIAAGGLVGLIIGPAGSRPASGGAVVIGVMWLLTIVDIRGRLVRDDPGLVSCHGAPVGEGEIGRLSPEDQAQVARFAALSFHPVGWMRQRFPLSLPGPRRLVLACPALHCFADVWTDGAPLFILMTPFLDGAVVITANHAWREIDEPDRIEGWVPGRLGPFDVVEAPSPAEVIEVHARRTAEMLRVGRRPFPSFSIADRARACEDFWRLHGPKVFAKMDAA